jgi:putative transposase
MSKRRLLETVSRSLRLLANVLERLNKEVRRRSRVVGIIRSRDSYLRLLTSYLMKYTEEWELEKNYIQPQKLELVMIKREELLQIAA